ncbi:MAG: NAD(P)/FAD-dependent oxidoreductase [Oscillospiraceae bacterium]|nr:NAD(P)/FAD-dependent oxidoreductase [Oscillospiraceae bacterium]
MLNAQPYPTGRYDVAVIGAGVVGTLIARALSRTTLRVVLLERMHDVSQGTSKANSAIVHAGYDAKPGSRKARMNVEGSRQMPTLCEALHVPLRINGSLVVAFAPEDMPTLEALLARGQKNGVPGLRLLGPAELFSMEPNLNPAAAGALYAPTGGIISPYELAIAAAECAVANGVELCRDFSVAGIDASPDGDFTIHGPRDLTARVVINAAGVHADEVARMIGDDSFRIFPRRGEYLLLDQARAGVVSATIFQCPTNMGKGVLITPTVHQNILLGPSAEDVEARDDFATTDAGLQGVLEAVALSVPGFVPRDVITSFTGIRAHCDRDDFVLEPSAAHPRFLHAAGIESPGLSAAPAIADYLLELVRDAIGPLEEKPDWNPGRKEPVRMRELSQEARREAIARNSAYGRIICRCETVSEGEILDAIHAPAGARDVDGVKRRTRAGMGRCQGGFCGVKVLELLARELGVAPEEITKSGGGSRILLERTE